MSEYPEKPADLVESAEESLVEEKKSVEAGVVELDVEREMRRLSRRSFLSGAAAATAGVGGWRWLATRREDDGIAWPLRRAHEINEQLARDYFRGTRLSPSFRRELAREPRANGVIGLGRASPTSSTPTGLQPAAADRPTRGGNRKIWLVTSVSKQKTAVITSDWIWRARCIRRRCFVMR